MTRFFEQHPFTTRINQSNFDLLLDKGSGFIVFSGNDKNRGCDEGQALDEAPVPEGTIPQVRE
jgi:hypothetical protein